MRYAQSVTHLSYNNFKSKVTSTKRCATMKKLQFLTTLAAVLWLGAYAYAIDTNLSPYKPRSSVSGTLKSIGSDTMLHEMQLWADGFKKIYPAVDITIEGKGSNTAPPALLSGDSQLAPMSRQMTPDETKDFISKFGYKPTGVLVAIDALAIYVHKDNPVKCLTLSQLDKIFSAEPQSEGGLSIKTWGDLGAEGEWATKPISLYGRNSLSGTNKFFRTKVLSGHDFKSALSVKDGSFEVVSSIESDPASIGYSGIGFKKDGVKTLEIAETSGGKCYDPSFEATYTHKYPLARGLYVYLLKDPKAPIDSLSGEFVKYILSSDGQAQAKNGGYYPITKNIREHELTRLGLLASAE